MWPFFFQIIPVKGGCCDYSPQQSKNLAMLLSVSQNILILQRNLSPPLWTLMMEVTSSSEKAVHLYFTVCLCHIPEDSCFQDITHMEMPVSAHLLKWKKFTFSTSGSLVNNNKKSNLILEKSVISNKIFSKLKSMEIYQHPYPLVL